MIRSKRAGWKVLGMVAAAGLLGAACSTDREVTRPAPEPVTEELLTGALIGVDDLPGGYRAVDEATPVATEVVPEHECDDALGDLEPELQASADFSNGTSTLSVSMAWYPGAGSAVERLHRDVRTRCEDVVVSEQGLSLRTGPLDFGVLSDDTLPLRFEVEPDSGAIQERDLILIRNGDLISTVRLTGPRPSDKVLLDSVVRTEIGRLGRLALDTT